MGNYGGPDLYVEERPQSAGPVTAVSTSTYATAGWLPKGKVNVATLVSGFDDYVTKFGNHWRNSYVSNAIQAFFDNAGAMAYVTRVVPADATKATNTTCFSAVATAAVFYTRKLTDPVTTLDATHYNINLNIDGGGAADIDVTGDNGVAGSYALSALATTLGGTSGITCSVEATLGGGNRIKVLSDSSGAASSLVFGTPGSNSCSKEFLGLDTASTSYTYTGAAAIDWTLEAAWQGAWYNQQRMCIAGNPDDANANGGWTSFNVEIQEESSVGAADWTTLESYESVVLTPDTDEQFISTVVNTQTDNIKITAGSTYGVPPALKEVQRQNECLGEGDAATVTFSGILLFPGVEEESLTIVAGSIEATDDGAGVLSGTGVSAGTINYTTGAWSITYSAAPASGTLIMASYYTVPSATEVCCQLSGGTDGTGPITRGLISEGTLEATKAGIYAFNDIEEILNVSLPDFAGDVTVTGDLVTWAEDKKNRFIIATTSLGVEPQAAANWILKTAQYDSSYLAVYYPWVTIADPLTLTGRPLNIPPDGFIAGAFARTDTRRNVGKAPAGLVDGKILGAMGIERILSKGERKIVHDARINALVSSTTMGRSVWGARLACKDGEWRYVNKRRLFMFCEESIEAASWWTVFENNGPAMWARAMTQGRSFFLRIFRDGYLAGKTPDEAFKIVIDASNNPQENIDAGIYTADYYIAANKPNEFSRLRFQTKVQAAS